MVGKVPVLSKRSRVAILVVIGVTGVSAAIALDVQKRSPTEPWIVPFDKLEWRDAKDVEGIREAVVEGSRDAGTHYTAVSAWTNGTRVGPISHARPGDLSAVVIHGRFRLRAKNEQWRELADGSYFTIPAEIEYELVCAAQDGKTCVLYAFRPVQ